MHRQRTRLAARAPRGKRYVEALERRGVATTYELHEHLLANRSSRRLFTASPPQLDEVQRDVLARLAVDGYASLPFEQLVPDESVRAAVEAEGATFIAGTERGLAQDSDGSLKRRAGKEFVVRAYSFDGVRLGQEHAWFRACLSSRLLDVANAYLRMWAKLSYVDYWYTVPQAVDSERKASQLWHLDFDDKHLLKAFLYLVDVDETAGPFEYVPGSQPGGRYESVWRWGPTSARRVSEEEVRAHVPAGGVTTFAAPRGTLILCNTSGLHRGGFSTSSPRVLATATYCSPASLKALSVRSYTVDPGLAAGLDGPQRYAVL